MQHPIDAMLQFDANANAQANVDASVNGPLRSIPTMRFFLQVASNAKNGFYTHSLRLTQQPIDAMLQVDANANARANLDASVNGP